MQLSRRVAGWLVAVALLGVTAPACAPKRIAPISAAPAPRPRPAAETPATATDTGSLPAAGAALDSIPAEWLERLEMAAGMAGSAGVEGPPEPEAAADSTGGPGEKVAALARVQVGKPYGWGATGPERFDCSGLALYVYRQLGIALPRVSSDQASMGTHVDRSELKPGDLVFFSLRSAFDHVGIFLGNNRFVHAPRRKEPVRVDNLDDAWWNRAYKGARRVFGGEP